MLRLLFLILSLLLIFNFFVVGNPPDDRTPEAHQQRDADGEDKKSMERPKVKKETGLLQPRAVHNVPGK